MQVVVNVYYVQSKEGEDVKNKIPKCTDCESHGKYPIGIGMKDRHWCGKIRPMVGVEKNIPAKDMRTSPKWCPKRDY